MNKLVRTVLPVLLAMLVLSAPAVAGIDAMAFKDAAQEKRYRHLASELRCLVCQNQSLADSNADLAGDLRHEILRLMNQGMSDKEITEYLVARYGDFVRYRPPVKPATWLLWFGPVLILLLAAGAMIVFVRNRNRELSDRPVLDERENQRLHELLDQQPKDPPGENRP